MTDVSETMPTDDAEPADEPDHIKNLRERAELASKLERELAATKAGIDLDSKQGRAWAGQYDGSWDDRDAMKADYSELFPSVEPAEDAPAEVPAADEQVPTSASARGVPEDQVVDPTGDFQTGMSADLRENQSGVAQPPGSTPTQNPWQRAMGTLEAARLEGIPEDHVRQQAIHEIISEAVDGNPDVIWSRDKQREWIERTGV